MDLKKPAQSNGSGYGSGGGMGSDFGKMSRRFRHRQRVQYIQSRNIGHRRKTIRQIATMNPLSCQAEVSKKGKHNQCISEAVN